MSETDHPQPDVLAALATGLPPLDPPALVKAQLLDLAEAPPAPIDAARYAWEEPFPGIRICLLKQDPARGMTGRLVWGTPGAIYPAHRHSGPEATLVLAGAYRDEHGRHAAGDVTRETEHTTHAIEILSEGDCFSYIVAYGETEIL
jgi:putative transcriptional regulator